jgi:hypothetical protein
MNQETAAEKLSLEFQALAQKAMAFDVLHRQYTSVYQGLSEFRPVSNAAGVNPDWICVRLKALALLLDNSPAQFTVLAGNTAVTQVAKVADLIETIATDLRAAQASLAQALPNEKSRVADSGYLRLAEAQLLAAQRVLAAALHREASAEETRELLDIQSQIDRTAAELRQHGSGKTLIVSS